MVHQVLHIGENIVKSSGEIIKGQPEPGMIPPAGQSEDDLHDLEKVILQIMSKYQVVKK